jgi:hypothetical protein
VYAKAYGFQDMCQRVAAASTTVGRRSTDDGLERAVLLCRLQAVWAKSAGRTSGWS